MTCKEARLKRIRLGYFSLQIDTRFIRVVLTKVCIIQYRIKQTASLHFSKALHYAES